MATSQAETSERNLLMEQINNLLYQKEDELSSLGITTDVFFEHGVGPRYNIDFEEDLLVDNLKDIYESLSSEPMADWIINISSNGTTNDVSNEPIVDESIEEEVEVIIDEQIEEPTEKLQVGPSIGHKLIDSKQSESLKRWLNFTGVEHVELRIVTPLLDTNNKVKTNDGKTYKKWDIGGSLIGFYDLDHLNEMSQEIVNWDGHAEGIYSTINDIDPKYLQIKANELMLKPGDGKGTQNNGVISFNTLFIDIDVEKPQKAAATKEQVDALLPVQEHIKTVLDKICPYYAKGMSGNGYNFYIPLVSHEVTDEVNEQRQEILNRINQYYQPEYGQILKIDSNVFNSGRITRLSGTMNKKGREDLHRECAVYVPKKIHRYNWNEVYEQLCDVYPEVVTEQKQSKNKSKETNKEQTNGGNNKQSSKDLTDQIKWLDEQLKEKATVIDGPNNSKHRLYDTEWIIECPFDSSHDNVKIYTGSTGHGWHCFHNSCSNYKWKDVRDKLGIEKGHKKSLQLSGYTESKLGNIGHLPTDTNNYKHPSQVLQAQTNFYQFVEDCGMVQLAPDEIEPDWVSFSWSDVTGSEDEIAVQILGDKDGPDYTDQNMLIVHKSVKDRWKHSITKFDDNSDGHFDFTRIYISETKNKRFVQKDFYKVQQYVALELEIGANLLQFNNLGTHSVPKSVRTELDKHRGTLKQKYFGLAHEKESSQDKIVYRWYDVPCPIEGHKDCVGVIQIEVIRQTVAPAYWLCLEMIEQKQNWKQLSKLND